MCGIEGLGYGRSLELHSAAYAEQVRQMRLAVEEQIRADAQRLMDIEDRQRREPWPPFLTRPVRYEAHRLAHRLTAAAAWRSRNPVLAAGWDDWSRLVREEGWR